jgi:hypothetical protein
VTIPNPNASRQYERDELQRRVFAIVKEALERENGFTLRADIRETVNHNCELVVTERRWNGMTDSVKLSVY